MAAHFFRARRAVATGIGFSLIATASVTTFDSGTALAAVDAALVEQLASAGQSLAMLSTLPDLAETVPGLATNPGLLLGMHEAFAQFATLDPLTDNTDAALASAIDAFDTGGYTFENVTVSVDGDVTTVDLDLSVDRTKDAGLAIVTDSAQLTGGSVAVGVTMPVTHLTFEYDDTIANAGDAFALVAPLPSLDFSVTLDQSIDESVLVGFAEASATGTFKLDVGASVGLTDPDGNGRLTGTELATADVASLATLDLAPAGAADVDVDLALAADVFGTMFTGALTIDDQSIFEDPAPAIALTATGANPIDLFTNIGSEASITALAQLVSGFGSAMIGGDVDLPFISDGVFIPGDLAETGDYDRIFEAIKPLLDYVEPRAAGQIVCGTAATSPDGGVTEGAPFGQTLFLDADDVAQCRAYTTTDGGSVQWQVLSGNATITDLGTSADTVGDSPTKNVKIDMTGPGELEVKVTYTPSGGSPTTILERPDTVQELLLELLGSGLIPGTGGIPEYQYEPALQAISFDIGTSVAGPISRSVSIDAGNEIVAQTGLSGLSAVDGGASASMSIEDIDAGVTLGLILADDVATINPADNALPASPPGPSDRFFLRGTESMLSVGDVSFTGNAQLEGRLGFLEILGTLNASLTSPDDDPAVAVGLGAPKGVTVGAGSDNTATLVNDLLRGGPGGFTVEPNLVFDGNLAVSSSVPGLSASGNVSIDWNLDDPAPTIDADTNFDNTLFPFDTAQSLTYTAAPTPADEAVFVTNPGLLAQAGLVGSQLVDPTTQATCTIVSVISDTSLRCENPAPSPAPNTPADVNPITFKVGTPYAVTGNTLAYLTEILAALEGLADYLEVVVGDTGLDTPIPVIGITPADLIGQISKLRSMIDEFRGVQDGQIICDVTAPAGQTDARAIASANGNATLACKAVAAVNAPSAIRWRAIVNGTPGPWVDGPDTVGSAPAAAVTLDLTGADTVDDDFIVLGEEYSVEVEWQDDGETRSSALPPRTPQSLTDLSESVSEILGLPDGVLEFQLLGVPATPTLRINLGYGICSSTPPVEGGLDCTGAAVGDTPTANLNVDLGGALPELVGLETTGQLQVRYAAIGQFDVGVPLTGGAPVLYGTSGIDVVVEVEGTDLGIKASVGPANATLGNGAGELTGNADNDNDDAADDNKLLDDAVDFDVDAEAVPRVPNGAFVQNTTDGQSCIGANAFDGDPTTTPDSLDCTLTGGAIWDNNDAYVIGDQSMFKAGLSFSISPTGAGGAVLGAGDSIAFNSPDLGLDVSDFAQVGNADCGPADTTYSTGNVIFGVDDGDTSLSGIACARLSMELGLGDAGIYLGELGLDFDGDKLVIYVPNDLATRLQEALLDPAFLLRALPPILAEIEGGLRDAANSGVPSAVADPLQVGADGINALKVGVEAALDNFGDLIAGAADVPQLAQKVDDELTALLTNDVVGVDVIVTTVCRDLGAGTDCAGRPLTDLDDISARLTFTGTFTAGTGVNLGLEGLPISFEAGIEGFAGWEAEFGIGVNRDEGPYLALNTDEADPELSFTAGVRLNDQGATGCDPSLAPGVAPGSYTADRCLKGRLAFLFIEALDRTSPRSNISAEIGLNITSSDAAVSLSDLLGGDIGIAPVISGGINLDLHVRTGISTPLTSTADLPTIVGTLHLQWGLDTDGNETPLSITFDNLHLDLGTFMNEFLNPIAKEIRKITGPLQPIIDVLMAPIPVISDLSELVGAGPVTMISLLEVASGADLSLVRAVAAFITFVNNMPSGSAAIPLGALTGGNGPGGVPARNAGAFSVNTAAAESTVSPANAGALIGASPAGKAGSGFAGDVAKGSGLNQATTADDRPATFGVPGLSFPFLEDASQIFGLLVGRDAVLVRWDAGTLEAEAGFSYDFGPIMVGPVPITITIGGDIGVRGRFAIGYDTSGIRKLLDGGSGFALFDGIFIDDLDANGNDVPEIEFFGRVFAGAAVDLVIVSAGVRGGIELTFSLDLDDRPDPDGKLRIEEIVEKLANPICLFVVSGKIEAFLEAFVEIDLFFYSEEFSFELVRITLLEWSSACEPPTPVLAEPDGDVLYINAGQRRERRNIQVDVKDESIEVRQIGPNKVRVSGFGWEEVHDGVGLIVADGGDGADELKFLGGTVEGTTKTRQPWTIPVVASGGRGDDVVVVDGDVGGGSGDHLFGDADIVAGSWAGKSYDAIAIEGGTSGKDQINAGSGDDLIEAGDADDRVDGQFGADTVLGGSGNDALAGGPGDDVVDGQGGNDTVQGGPIEQPAPNTPDPDDDDVLIGGPDRDVASGDFGNDIVFGDAVGASAVTTAADGRQTRNAPDQTKFLDWCDDAAGGSDGDDILTGTDGDDVLVGGGGKDAIDGGNGNDWGCGGPGDDNVLGQAGNDVLRGDGDQDTIDGADGNDIINGGGGNDTAVGGAGNDDIFGDGGSDHLTGNGGDDVIVGDTGSIVQPHASGVATADAIDAAKVQALDAAVTVDAGGAGPRRSTCDLPLGDSDCIFGSDGSDALFGGGDGDVVLGEAGADLVEGNEGDDDLRGSTGNDLLLGSAGADLIAGEGGADQAYGDRSIAEWLSNTPATGGNDVITGGPDADHLEGDGGTDDIQGGAAGDHIEGNNGADKVRGDAGNDDIIGGSDTDQAVGDGADTGDTSLLGGTGNDVMAGDNAAIAAGGPVLGRAVDLNNPDNGAGDHIEGDAGSDAIFGQAGDDDIWGDLGMLQPDEGPGGADYVEGNRGIDEIAGEAGDDDLIGGSSAVDGVIDADRSATGEPDAGDQIQGGDGLDVIAGDNALVNRLVPSSPANAIAELFDVALATVPSGAATSGQDVIGGGAEQDLIFGQGKADVIHGDDGADYVEGNDGDDRISGDAGNDDLVGGGSANDGIIDGDRVGTDLADVGETLVSGGSGDDWITGDNALIDRNVDSAAPAPIVLFDVETVSSGAEPGTGGGEVKITGGSDPDWIFGQTGDDDIEGNDGADYVEGNNGADTIKGGNGNDDLVGGGSANDGVIDADRVGNGLLDVADPDIDGGAGQDWITGDNALVNRNRPADGRAEIELFDVDTATSTPGAGTSGGEPAIAGGTDTDRIFGQGGNDAIAAGDAQDYVEGNHGDDSILGGAGADELIGGGSADDGEIDGDRIGSGLEDGRDTIDGQQDDDRIAGDNAIIVGIVPANTGRAPIELFDVQVAGGPVISTLTSGGDTLYGDVGADRIFGGGNGSQPASQTDPTDDRNNDFVGSTSGTPDFDRYPAAAGVDEDGAATWQGDVILGGLGDDTIEGNHGNDLILGNGTNQLGQDEDDINGGGSANDGRIYDGARQGLGSNLLDGADTIHGDSTDNRQGDDDAVVGDNGWVLRLATKQSGQTGPDGAAVDQWDRNTQMSSSKTAAGTFGNDFVSGNGGHDELFGQMGDDYVEGGWGSDAMIGDLGRVTTDLFTDDLGNGSCGAARTISPNEPFVQDPVCQRGTLFRLVQLYAYDDTVTTGVNAVAAGNDVMLGLDGDDWIHGGPGLDMINGDGDGGTEIPATATTPAQIPDPNTASADTDRIFGGDSNGRGTVDPNSGGNGDAVWGGRGHDHTYGGRGDDMLDVRPNVALPQFFPLQWSAWAEADVESYHGIDVMYGGYDQDAMQANIADNGPVVGDRLFDWVGAYNIYYLCPATYGAYVNIRDQSPAILAYFETQAAADGALTPKTAGTSGFNELAMVYKPDVKNNANPIYPGTPGHFFCGV